MAAQLRTEPVKKACRPCDNRHKVSKQPTATVPASWTLTEQQQAFIDSFAEDESKKQ